MELRVPSQIANPALKPRHVRGSAALALFLAVGSPLAAQQGHLPDDLSHVPGQVGANDALVRPASKPGSTDVHFNTGGTGPAKDAQDALSASAPVTLRRAESSTQPIRSAAQSAGRLAGFDGLALLGPLLVVLVLIFLLAWFLRRRMARSPAAADDALRVLTRHPLSARHSLCLVRVGRRLALIGVSPDRITQLSEITDPAEAAELVAAVERARAGSFTAAFSRFLSGEAGRDEEEPAVEFHENLGTGRVGRTGESVRGLVRRVRQLNEHAPAGEAA